MAQAPAGKTPLGKNRVVRPPPSTEPAPAQVETETPKLSRLTAIVALCFSAGFAWPVFGGLQFVQRPPGSSPPKTEEVEPAPPESDPPAPEPSPAEVPVMRAEPIAPREQATRELPRDPATRQPIARIEGRVVQSCHGGGGEAASRCDTPKLEGVLDAPISRLVACDAAAGANGVLSLGLFLDFGLKRVSRVKLGQSTSLPRPTAAALVRCAEEVVIGARLNDVEHEHAGYWVYHLVRFLPPGSAVDPESLPPSEPVVKTSGQVTIGFTTAVVREEPSQRSRVSTRLPYGTRLNVNARAGEWYRVEQGGKAIGWLHRKAIGL